MQGFLEAIETAIDDIFESDGNPKRLSRVTPNDDYLSRNCKLCQGSSSAQCDTCAVTVSRTKVGTCLQFQWTPTRRQRLLFGAERAYCSVDIVPKFDVEAIEVGLYYFQGLL